MGLNKIALAGVCFGMFAAAASAQSSRSQFSCTSSQDAAVRCFVMNAASTNLVTPHFGMSLTQFEAYGVAVSRILQTQHTYLVLVGTSSAIADALPPTNADGSPSAAAQTAQSAAVNSIVTAALADGFASAPSGVNTQQLQWFALDLVDAMNATNGFMQLLTPGVGLRLIDSYLLTATSNGAVDWTQVQTSLSTAVDNMVAAGMMKLPSGMTASQVKAFAVSLAQAINTYKVATGRKNL